MHKSSSSSGRCWLGFFLLFLPLFGQSVARSIVPQDRGHCWEAGAVPAEASDWAAQCSQCSVRSGSPRRWLILWDPLSPPAFALLSFRDVTSSGHPKCSSWPAGSRGGRDRGRGTDGMGKAGSGGNELGRAEVPLIGTVTSNPAQSSLFTVAEREGRRKAAWQDAQS